MAEEPNYFILKGPDFPLGSEADAMLGRIVRYYGNPFAAYTPKDTSTYTEGNIRENELENFETIVQSTKSFSLKALLSTVFKITWDRNSSSKLDFSGKILKTKRLQLHEDIFDKMLQENTTVKTRLMDWLTLGGRPAFMIVGVVLWKDASLESSAHQDSKLSAEGEVDGNKVLLAAGIASPVDPGKLSLGLDKGESEDKTLKGESKGWHVFALEYRCVRRPLVSTYGEFKLDKQPRYAAGRSFGSSANSAQQDPQSASGGDDSEFFVDDEVTPWTMDPSDLVDDEGKKPEIEEADGCGFVF